MGCFYATCAVTNLPILPNDEVYIIPVHENFNQAPDSYRSFSGPFTFWRPLPYMFEGIYNDDEGFAQYESGFGFEKLNKKIGEKWLSRNESSIVPLSYYPDHKRICRAMYIRKDVADKIFSEWKQDTFWDKSDKTFHTYFEEIKSELIRRLSDPDDNMAFDTVRIIRQGILTDDQHKFLVFSFQFACDGSDNFVSLFDLKCSITHSLEFGTQEDAENELKAIFQIMALKSFFEDTRKVFLPNTHLGSQSSDISPYQFLLGITAEEINTIDKKYEEDEE